MILTDLKIAIKSLRTTKVRTGLTMLGIVIGVASLTIVLALGEGAKQKVREQVEFLGPSLLTVRPGKANRDTNGNITDYNFLAALGSSTVSERDLHTVEHTKGIDKAAPIMAVTGSVSETSGKPGASGSTIIATTPDLNEVMNFRMRSGEFINDATNRETVVLGFDIANELLGSDTAIGRKISVRGKEFTVIGILNRYDVRINLNNLYDFNRTAFIPLDAGKEFNQGIAQIQQINARVGNGQDTKAISGTLYSELLQNHGGEEDFTVLHPEETVQITDNLLRFVTMFTSAIASISLIVGGIGIMNIMLVSVTERTREIGIRKAVGATNSQVLRQFLIEALLMSIVGGLLGVALAYGVAWLIGSMFEFVPIITPLVLVLALGISTVVGVIFGVTPAIKASRKDPIEALRFYQ